MLTIRSIIEKDIELRSGRGIEITLLAVCPNSEAVLAAGVKAAALNNTVMLFAATLNQVDLDGGYTGWTPQQFVQKIDAFADKYVCKSGLYACLDHGGPWLKDKDTLNRLTFDETFANVKLSIEACIRAGYALLHIDPTVDRSFAPGTNIPVETVVERTVELIAFAEDVRKRLGLPEVSYEVGTEEVHGGMVDLANFERFISLLRQRLQEEDLLYAWPAFFVAQVGTDLHTTRFDPLAAAKIFEMLVPLESLAKGHYTDWVEAPGRYPESGMGGANVGPEFTAEEYKALGELEARERTLLTQDYGMEASRFIERLTEAVLRSNRWKKWLSEDESGLDFEELSPERKAWLVQTGCRYVWTDAGVLAARAVLYKNLSRVMPDPNEYAVDRIVASIEKYITSFNLFNSQVHYR